MKHVYDERTDMYLVDGKWESAMLYLERRETERAAIAETVDAFIDCLAEALPHFPKGSSNEDQIT